MLLNNSLTTYTMKQTNFGAHKAETFSLWAVLRPWLQLLAIYQSVGHAKIFSQKMNHNHHLCLGFHLRNNNHNLRQHHRQLCHQSQACNHPHHDVEAEHDVQVKPLVQWEKLDMSSLERRKLCCSVTFHAVSFSRHSFPLSSIFSQYFFSPLSLTFHRPGRHHLCCLVALCFNRQVRRGSPKYEYRISSIEYQVSSIEYRVLRIDY